MPQPIQVKIDAKTDKIFQERMKSILFDERAALLERKVLIKNTVFACLTNDFWLNL